MAKIDALMVTLDDTERRPTTLLPDPPAEELWCPIISADDHVLEPANMFIGRVPSRLADRVPRQVTVADGVPLWEVEGCRYAITNTNAAVGRPRSEWNAAPQRYDELRQGTWDPKARLMDMDLTGVWAQLGFSSVPWGFAGSRFSQMSDQEAGLAAVRAYNDWLLEEWCATAPDRYIPNQVTWLRDPWAAADEVHRNAERGFHAVSFSENPETLGFGSIHGNHWDPFFSACEETETVINLHVGSSGEITKPSADSPHETTSALFPLNGIVAVVDWIFARVPIRFPGIKIALSEAGTTWVPMVAERLRRAYRGLDVTTRWKATDPPPVDLLFRNFWFTSVEDPAAFRMLDLIGVDRVMVETDYPHYDSTWPRSQELIRDELSHLAPKQIQALCYGNAASLYKAPPPPADWIARSVVGRCDLSLTQ
jgi:predicted TIM-barrel fold metal-dependent hydrolase